MVKSTSAGTCPTSQLMVSVYKWASGTLHWWIRNYHPKSDVCMSIAVIFLHCFVFSVMHGQVPFPFLFFLGTICYAFYFSLWWVFITFQSCSSFKGAQGDTPISASPIYPCNGSEREWPAPNHPVSFQTVGF